MNRSDRLQELGDRQLRHLARVDRQRVERDQRMSAATYAPRGVSADARLDTDAATNLEDRPRRKARVRTSRSWPRRSIAWLSSYQLNAGITELAKRHILPVDFLRPSSEVETAGDSAPFAPDGSLTELPHCRTAVPADSHGIAFSGNGHRNGAVEEHLTRTPG